MCPAVWLSRPCPSVSQGQHQKAPAEGGVVPGEAGGAGKLLWGWRGVVVPHLPALLGQGASILEEGEQFYDCPTKSEDTGMLSRVGDWLCRLDCHHFPGTETRRGEPVVECSQLLLPSPARAASWDRLPGLVTVPEAECEHTCIPRTGTQEGEAKPRALLSRSTQPVG